MKKELLKLSTILSVLFFNSLLFSMLDEGSEDCVDALIEFCGEKKPLSCWIVTCKCNPNHPFATTAIIRKTGNICIRKGTLSSLTREDNQDLIEGNYVYFPNFDRTKSSGEKSVVTAAILLGTKDKNDINTLQNP